MGTNGTKRKVGQERVSRCRGKAKLMSYGSVEDNAASMSDGVAGAGGL